MAKKKDNEVAAADSAAASEGMVLMRGPKGCSQIGVPIGNDEVEVYTVREDSDVFEVHRDHVSACTAHGFAIVENE